MISMFRDTCAKCGDELEQRVDKIVHGRDKGPQTIEEEYEVHPECAEDIVALLDSG